MYPTKYLPSSVIHLTATASVHCHPHNSHNLETSQYNDKSKFVSTFYILEPILRPCFWIIFDISTYHSIVYLNVDRYPPALQSRRHTSQFPSSLTRTLVSPDELYGDQRTRGTSSCRFILDSIYCEKELWRLCTECWRSAICG